MSEAKVDLILWLLPIAEKLIFAIGDKLVSLDVSGLTHEQLLAAIKDSRQWPELKFESPAK